MKFYLIHQDYYKSPSSELLILQWIKGKYTDTSLSPTMCVTLLFEVFCGGWMQNGDSLSLFPPLTI